MDRDLAPQERRKRLARHLLAAVAAIAVAAVSLAAGIDWLRPAVERQDLRTARVEKGSMESTLHATGAVVPLVEEVVSSPVEARVLRIERRAGDRVRPGDALLTLDTSATRLEALRLDERVAQKENAASELVLRLDDAIASQQASLEQKRLDVEILSFVAEQKTRLRNEGLIAEQDALAASAAARKAAIELRQIEAALERSRELRRVQLAAAQGDLSLTRRERDESRRQLELAMLRAEREGVLTAIIGEPGALVRRGDIVARVADLSSYRVEGTISDIHAARLRAGQPVHVKLDGATIGGAIDSVDPRIVNGIVRFFVTLDEPAHPKLRNNLRVELAVVGGVRHGVRYVERGALGRSEHAFVVRGDFLQRVAVRFGATGDQTIEVVSGLREGEEIVISDMSNFEQVKQVKLR